VPGGQNPPGTVARDDRFWHLGLMPDAPSYADAASYAVRPRISHHQYQVESDRDRFDDWPDSPDGLLTGEDTWFAVITGVEYGHADVILRLLGEPGPLDPAYEMAAERDFWVQPDHGIDLYELLKPQPLLSINAPAALYRVRVSVTGRWAAAQPREDNPIEQHLIELWPADNPSPPAALTDLDQCARSYLGR